MTLQGHAVLPDGEYGFLEFYCNEAGCDCRRALFMVVSPDPSLPVWQRSTMAGRRQDFYPSEGWEYRNWPTLAAVQVWNRWGEQSPFAAALLKLLSRSWRTMPYVERLKRTLLPFFNQRPPVVPERGRPRSRVRGRRRSARKR